MALVVVAVSASTAQATALGRGVLEMFVKLSKKKREVQRAMFKKCVEECQNHHKTKGVPTSICIQPQLQPEVCHGLDLAIRLPYILAVVFQPCTA
jgi:hypothetical protein